MEIQSQKGLPEDSPITSLEFTNMEKMIKGVQLKALHDEWMRMPGLKM